jgi:hypothetical protein
MNIDDLPQSFFTETQWRGVQDRWPEWCARAEAASWVIYQDRRFIGGFEPEKRSMIYRAALTAMELSKPRSFGLCDELFQQALEAAEAAHASPQAA